MRKLTLLLLVLLAPFAAGQMTSGYSSYANYGGDGDGGHLFITVVLDGATGRIPIIALHTGKVQITLNGVTTQAASNPVSPNTYITVSSTNTMDDAVAGDDYAAAASAVCGWRRQVFWGTLEKRESTLCSVDCNTEV